MLPSLELRIILLGDLGVPTDDDGDVQLVMFHSILIEDSFTQLQDIVCPADSMRSIMVQQARAMTRLRLTIIGSNSGS